MTQPHKIIALTKYSHKGASSRVRFWNLAPRLRNLGWEVEVWPLLDDKILEDFYQSGRHNRWRLFSKLFARITSMARARPPSLWWVEKELHFGMPACVDRVLAPFVSRTVFDYDDAVFLHYADSWADPFGRIAKFRHYARHAAFITVGSQFLNDQMKDWGAKRIRKIPSTVPVAKYPVRIHAARSTVLIGWIGTPVTVRSLDTLREILPTLASRIKFQLHVVGAQWQCEGVDVVCSSWSEETEAEMVASFDIGIMPLVDRDWERAKCGYKLIQYMAAGVVPLGSRVGENNIIIQEGINGFLADTPAEWLAKLELLCRDQLLRATIGARAREKALKEYDISCSANAMHEIFKEVLAKREGPAPK